MANAARGQEETPLVSIGLPVKNGETSLAEAIDNILSQPYKNIELIISNNCSTDGTAEICSRAAAADCRVRVIHQAAPLSASDNFAFVLKEATGRYFMWAAHDDTRSPNFIERLVDHLETNPDTILAFGELELCYPNKVRVRHHIRFDTVGRGVMGRLWRTSQVQYYHLYGLWRRELLQSVQWFDCPFWPDIPYMMGAAVKGSFAKVPDTVFYRYERIKSNVEIINYFYGVMASKLSRATMLSILLRCTMRGVSLQSNYPLAWLAAIFVTIRFIRQSLRVSERRQRKMMARQGYG